MAHRSVAVVGAGIAGLAAAWELAGDPGIDVLLLDASPAVGGKLRTAEVAGHHVDVGAESMLGRRPEALDLMREAGLADRVVRPRREQASVWSRGRLWPLPAGTVMGVPRSPEDAAGLLTPDEVARARAERVGPPVDADVAVGRFVADRVGPAVVDRLVEPLLAGVYAGHAHRLSLQATVPALWEAARTGIPIVGRSAPPATDADAGPVFAGYLGGLGAFATQLGEALARRGARVRTGATVRALTPTAEGWRLTVGPTNRPEAVDVDGVVLALPAAPAARLLGPSVPAAAAALAEIRYASVAIVTLALPRSELPRSALPSGSGFLVPPVEPLAIKAATFSARKWAWVDALDPDVVLLRASLGRAGEARVLQHDDADLVTSAMRDLSTVWGRDLPRPIDTHVQRWGGGLPQYAVGHLERVRTVLDAVARVPTLGVAGAEYEGVGIPACVASGRHAARQVAAQLHPRQ